MHAAAAEEDHGDQRGSGVKAEGAAGDGADLAVESFGASVGEAGSNVLEDAAQVTFNRACRAGEMVESARLRAANPLEQHVAGHVDLPAIEDLGERLLEDVSAEDRLVGFLKLLEGLVLGIGEIPRALEQGPARVLEGLLVLFGRGRPNLVTARLVQRILDQALHVEAIEHEPSVRDLVLDDTDVGLRHVDRHALDRRAPLGPQLIEEGLQSLGVLSLRRPDHYTSLVVDDDGDVLVVAPVAELVNADVLQPVEAISGRLECTIDDPTDDPADSPPGNAQEPRDRRAIALLGEIPGALFECVGEVAAWSGPRDLFGLHRTARIAVNTPDLVAQVHHHPSEVKVAPPTGTTVLHSTCLATAFPAPDGPPSWGNLHDQAEVLEVEAPDDEVLDGQDDSEYGRCAHDGVPGEGSRHPMSGARVVRINHSPLDTLQRPPIPRFAPELFDQASTKGAGEPENVPYYERHGFEVVGELKLPKGPPVWRMLYPSRS